VRRLSKEVGLAPSVIQSVRSGEHANMTLNSFLKLVTALGGEVTIRKGKDYLPVKIAV